MTTREFDDEQLYAYLLQTQPEGKEELTPTEQEEFEHWLGV